MGETPKKLKKGKAEYVCRTGAGAERKEAVSLKEDASEEADLPASLVGRPGEQEIDDVSGVPGVCGSQADDFTWEGVDYSPAITFFFLEGLTKSTVYGVAGSGQERDPSVHLVLTDHLDYAPLHALKLTRAATLVRAAGERCFIRQLVRFSAVPELIEEMKVTAASDLADSAGVIYAKETAGEMRHWPSGMHVYRVRLDDGREQSYGLRDEAIALDALPLYRGLQGEQRLLRFEAAAVDALAGRLGSVRSTNAIDEALPVSPPGSPPYVCTIKQYSIRRDVRSPLERYMGAVDDLQTLLPALASMDEKRVAYATFLQKASSLLSWSEAGMLALQASRRDFNGLSIFGPRIEFWYDTMHATVNSMLRVLNKMLVVAHILGPEFVARVKTAFGLMHIPYGRQKTKSGAPRNGDFPLQVYMCRGHQADAAVKSRYWERLRRSVPTDTTDGQLVHALAHSFESTMANLYMLHWALHHMRARSQTFFLGAESGPNMVAVEDRVKFAWYSVRRHMCWMFPGECQINNDPTFVTDAWMMRSFHIIFHAIHSLFLKGKSPVDASTIEQMQAESRSEHLDGTSYQWRMLETKELLERKELAKQAAVKTTSWAEMKR